MHLGRSDSPKTVLSCLGDGESPARAFKSYKSCENANNSVNMGATENADPSNQSLKKAASF